MPILTRSRIFPFTSIWLMAIFVASISIGIGSWKLVYDVLPFVLNSNAQIVSMGDISTSSILRDKNSELDNTLGKVEKTASDFTKTSTYFIWLGRFAPAVAWLPPLNSKISNWTIQSERLSNDLNSASALLSTTNALLKIYKRSHIPLSGEITNLDNWMDEVNKLKQDFEEISYAVTQTIERSHKFKSSLTITNPSNPLSQLTHIENQMLDGAMVGNHMTSLLISMIQIGDIVNPLVSEFKELGLGTEQLNLDSLHTKLLTVQNLVQETQEQSAEIVGLLNNIGVNDNNILAQIETVQKILTVLFAVNQASLIALDMTTPFGLPQPSKGLLSEEGTLTQILDNINAQKDQTTSAILALESATETLTELNADDQLSFSLKELSNFAEIIHDGLHFIHTVAPVGRDLFGSTSPKRYLVLGQSADELRATGGFVSSLWLVSFLNGTLEGTRYHDSVRVDDWDRLILYPKAPSGLEEHMNAQVWLLRDVSWEPDFPTAATTAKDMYRLGQRREVDGVVAITQWALLEIIRAVGETTAPGDNQLINSRNFLSTLEQGTDKHGRAYVDLALQGVLARLKEPMSFNMVLKLASAVYRSLQTREMLVYLNGDTLQSIVTENNWDGGIKNTLGDYLYVVDSNVGWSKSDRNIERSIKYSVDLRRKTRPRASLNLTYNNHSGPGSPSCEPQWRNRGTNYTQLKNACYWNYFRVYLPQSVTLLTNNLLPLPDYSVSAHLGHKLPGNDTVEITSSYNKSLISGLFSLEAGGKQYVDLVYDLPQNMVSWNHNTIQYRLLIQKQPGVRQRQISVELLIPKGYHLKSSSRAPTSSSDTRIEFIFPIKQDIQLDVNLTKETKLPN